MLSCIDLSFYADAALNTHFEWIGAHQYTAGSGFTTEGTTCDPAIFCGCRLNFMMFAQEE